MKKNLLIITIGLSLGLGGCSSVLYNDSLAPVYSISSGKNQTVTSSTSQVKPQMKTDIHSIERPNQQPIVVNDGQNNPYGTPMRPSAVRPNMNTAGTVTATGAATPIATEAANKAQEVAANDPRVKEASQVLANAQSNVQQVQQQTTATVQAARPSNINNTVNNAQQTVVNSAATAATAAVTPPSPATAQSATKSLLQEARTSVASGNYNKAASALERAHRIDPRNAKILYDIAQIRYAQGKYRQSESFASKAANYTKSPALSKKIWTILANSRKALGNSTGAAAAARKAANF